MKIAINGTFEAPGDSIKDVLLRLAIRLKQMAHSDEPERSKDGWQGTVEIVGASG